MPNQDVAVLRDLAKQVADIAAKPVQDERRDLWRRHNSLQRTRPLIYMRWFGCFDEVCPPSEFRCQDPLFRSRERALRQMILQDRTGDDFIIEPWLTAPTVYKWPPDDMRRWGVEIKHTDRTAERGSWKFTPAIIEEADIDKLIQPHHEIDESATARDTQRLQEAVGDILPINIDRGPYYRMWIMDLSTDLAQLLGLQQMMLYMMDRPEWLHRILDKMRDGILQVQGEAEKAGDWRLAHQENQAMPYALELADPAANSAPVKRKDLWCFMASQETTLVSPDMFDEFILSHQMPIMSHFGLVAYGCCENLSRKIDKLRKIPNLRRISVTPFADVKSCAEQIGSDYVMSYRPSPAQTICTRFDPDYVRNFVREALDIAKANDCIVDITLKDVETVGGDFNRLVEWTRVVRQLTEEYA